MSDQRTQTADTGTGDRPVRRVVERETLRRAIAELRDGRRAEVHLTPRVREAVVDYVGALRAGGDTPERMLRRVKDVVTEAELADVPLDESTTVMSRVVRWSIEAYYDEPALQGVPRFF